VQPGAAAGPLYIYPDGDVLESEGLLSDWVPNILFFFIALEPRVE